MRGNVEPRSGTVGLLRELRAVGSVDMAFAASVDMATASFVLDRFDGARAGSLNGVRSAVGDGLGGRCIALRRPVYVAEYVTARGISHQYDGPVSAEGLRSIVAVPVLERDVVCSVVYAGTRGTLGFGQRTVDRVVALVRAATPRPVEPAGSTAVRDDLDELRAIASAITEPELRRRLENVVRRVAGEPREVAWTSLTGRERDVLGEVAFGRGNREVGIRLGLTEQTVKSYLKAAMSKLDSHTRGEAVHRAREAGLLP